MGLFFGVYRILFLVNAVTIERLTEILLRKKARSPGNSIVGCGCNVQFMTNNPYFALLKLVNDG